MKKGFFIIIGCLGFLIMGSEAPTWQGQVITSGIGFIMLSTASGLLVRSK